jgi:kynurenine formamidase
MKTRTHDFTGSLRLVDLSHAITPGMPVWPGTPGPELIPLASIASDGFAEQSIRLSSHTGTHLDAPAHILEGGATLDRLDPGRFFGSAMIVDALELPGGSIGLDLLEPYSEMIASVDFVLFHTGWSRYWGQGLYDQAFPMLDDAAASWIAGIPLKGAGLDCPSFDHPWSRDYPVHRRLLEAGILLIENLTNLHLLPASGFSLSVFPLGIAGAEACPVRAVALV